MKIRAGYGISFDCQNPMPILLNLDVHPDRRGDLLTSDQLQADRAAEITPLLDLFGNRVTRVMAPAGPMPRLHLARLGPSQKLGHPVLPAFLGPLLAASTT